MTDSEIIALFNERSQKAIVELSKKYKNLSLKIASNILNNPLDSEECVNDALLVLWNKIPPENPHSLCSYLLKVTRNLSLKKYHQNTALKRNSFYDTALEELEEILYSKTDVAGEFDAKVMENAINTFLSLQEKSDRILFVRRYFYGDAVNDIAKKMNTDPNFVSVRLKRIRTKLKNYLVKEELI